MTPEQIKNKYEERIVTLLQKLVTVLTANDFTVDEPCDMSDDTYRWAFTVRFGDSEKNEKNEENDVDFIFTICESEQCDGTKNGVNFMLDITTVGGSCLGGVTPYNYTDRVWVNRNEENEIEDRFKLMEETFENLCEDNQVVELMEDQLITSLLTD